MKYLPRAPSGDTEVKSETKQHNSKKPKHNLDLEDIPEEMEVKDDEGDGGPVEPLLENSWATKLFPEQCQAANVYPIFIWVRMRTKNIKGLMNSSKVRLSLMRTPLSLGLELRSQERNILACFASAEEP